MREWCQGRRLAAELESELGIPDLSPYTYQPTICSCLHKIALIHSNFSNYPFNVKIFAFDSLILILEFHILSMAIACCLIFDPSVHVHFILPNSVKMLQGWGKLAPAPPHQGMMIAMAKWHHCNDGNMAIWWSQYGIVAKDDDCDGSNMASLQ